jgi:hypothetical protein
VPRPDHLEAVARLALAMRDEIAAIAGTGRGWLVVRMPATVARCRARSRRATVHAPSMQTLAATIASAGRRLTSPAAHAPGGGTKTVVSPLKPDPRPDLLGS